MADESEKSTGIIYKINLIGGKCYIGKTTKTLQERMAGHARLAVLKSPKTSNNLLPFLPPYRNFVGKNSSFYRLITDHKKALFIKSLSINEQILWLINELLRRTVVLEVIEANKVRRQPPQNELSNFYNFKDPLSRAERHHIYEAWIENPRQLVNYKGLPIHSAMQFELFDALNVSLEKLGNVAFSKHSNEYYLNWDYENELYAGDLSEQQKHLWETERKRQFDASMKYWQSLSEEDKQLIEEEHKADYEEERFWVAIQPPYKPYEFTPVPSGGEIAECILQRLLPIDRRLVENNRKSGFNKKKAELARELKRIELLTPDERRKLIEHKYW